MTDVNPMAVPPVAPVTSSRRTKFTPERIQQIINLVERGKRREEIAEIIGVTTAALQVACSRLGVSLRRPVIDVGVNFFPRKRVLNQTHNSEVTFSVPETGQTPSDRQIGAAVGGHSTKTNAVAIAEQQHRHHVNKVPLGSASFELRMYYRGEERVTALPLDPDTIRYLALEAEFRGMRIGELITRLIMECCNERPK